MKAGLKSTANHFTDYIKRSYGVNDSIFNLTKTWFLFSNKPVQSSGSGSQCGEKLARAARDDVVYLERQVCGWGGCGLR